MSSSVELAKAAARFFHYRVEWSEPHKSWVGLVAEFPTVMFMGVDRVEAEIGVVDAVVDVLLETGSV